tara:strand:+ start:52 stop:510 length:459 start_codon:yes stop_codon:yes gene_type:complete
MVLGFLRSKEAKLKVAESKRRKDKIKAYKKLQEKMAGDEYKASDTKGKKTRKVIRDSFNKQRRKSGTIAAKGMPDIAGDIKASGDPYLGKLGMLKTKYKTKKDADAAGRFSKKDPKTGKRKILDPYAKGGKVKKYEHGGMVTTKGWGIARKT